MKYFILSLLKFLLPLGAVLAIPLCLYVKQDPYRDFRNYDNYSWQYNFQALGDLSTKKLISRPKDYNSFIFGSSRSTTVYGCYLQKKFPGSKFFHYANWVETIGGIARKLEFLDSQGYKINNVVLCIDTDATFKFDGKCNSSDHYLLTNKTPTDQKLTHVRNFFSRFNLDRLKILLGLSVEGEVYPNWQSDLRTNDPKHICSESVIANYGKMLGDQSYTNQIDALVQNRFFYKRKAAQQYERKQISECEEAELRRIAHIFDKHKTNYFIIIISMIAFFLLILI